MDWLARADTSILLLFNTTLSNPVGDILWPLITNYDRFLPVRILLLVVWLWLLIKGGRRGRTAALLVPVLLLITDQLSSTFLKEIVARPRPCHEIGGVPVVSGLRLLVDCGPGKSFPSSHAVNSFALALFFTHFYPKAGPYLYVFAALVSISRVAVGVHYPSDVIGGALFGSLLAMLLLLIWKAVERRFLPPEEHPA